MSLTIVNRQTIIVNSLAELQANVQYIRPGNIYLIAGAPWEMYVCFTGTTLTKVASSSGSIFPSTAWTQWTPTVAFSAGTPTVATLEAYYQQVGKTVFFRLSYQVTLTVSNATSVTFDCPVTPKSMSGFQSLAGNLQLVSSPTVNFAGINDNTSKIFMLAAFTQVAQQIDISGVYEAN